MMQNDVKAFAAQFHQILNAAGTFPDAELGECDRLYVHEPVGEELCHDKEFAVIVRLYPQALLHPL